jgi:Vitamin K epoxide reductase family
LAALGLVAYSVVALLALLPLLVSDSTDDTENRIWLTAATTTMGTFSVFLMSILFGVLHTSCPYCLLSAVLSIGMAGIVWVGGGLPDEERERGMQTCAGSFATSVLAALVLFFSADSIDAATQFAGSSGGNDQTLLASTEGLKPPPITTKSTERSLALATKLNELDAKMFGAYW